MWTHIIDTEPVARKDHNCILCERVIQKGDRHVARRGIQHGDGPVTIRMHIACEAMTSDWDEGDWESHDCSAFRDALDDSFKPAIA